MKHSIAPEAHPTERSQFSLQSVFWVMIASSLVLAYAGSLGPQAVSQALRFAAAACVFGIAFGCCSRRLLDSCYWASLVSLLAFLAIAGGRLTNEAIVSGWGVVGAFCGALGALDGFRGRWIGPCVSSLGAGCLMLLCVKLSPMNPANISGMEWFDIVCAAAIGAVLYPAIKFLIWFETASKHPRFVMASWMTLFVMLGNLLVPVLSGSPR